jgi:hypothetical protein
LQRIAAAEESIQTHFEEKRMELVIVKRRKE